MANYNTREFGYASSDGKNHIAAYLFTPKERTPTAVIQLVHGMCEYTGRYGALIDALTGAGYAVCSNDHLGHGHTARHSEDLGYFASEDGADTLVTDVHKLTLLMRSQFKGAPLILIGHSMGSFLSRLSCISYYRDIDGAVFLGTGNSRVGAMLGRIAAQWVIRRKGARYRSPGLTRLTFGRYNHRTGGDSLGYEWLTRDDEAVCAYCVDPYCNFTFTASAYADLFSMVERCSSPSWAKAYPKSLPTLIASGDADPVGAYGKGPQAVYNRLLAAGASDVKLKLYEGARHELQNEWHREVFFGDLLAWLKERY